MGFANIKVDFVFCSFGCFLEMQNVIRQDKERIRNSLCDIEVFSFTNYSTRGRNLEPVFDVTDLYCYGCCSDF